MHTMVYYPDRGQLLVITNSCSLNVLGRDEQLAQWVSLAKMKFATATGEAAISLQARVPEGRGPPLFWGPLLLLEGGGGQGADRGA